MSTTGYLRAQNKRLRDKAFSLAVEKNFYKTALEKIAGMSIQYDFDEDASLIAQKALEKYDAKTSTSNS